MGIKPVRSCTGSIPSLRKNECTAVISGEVPWELACIAQLLRRFHGISCSKAVLCSQGKAQHTRGRGCAQQMEEAFRVLSAFCLMSNPPLSARILPAGAGLLCCGRCWCSWELSHGGAVRTGDAHRASAGLCVHSAHPCTSPVLCPPRGGSCRVGCCRAELSS